MAYCSIGFRYLSLCVAAISCFVFAERAGAERLTPETMTELGRIGDAAVSSDGRVAFLVTHYDVSENTGTTSLHLLAPTPPESLQAKVTAIGFDCPLAAQKTQTLLRNVKGLGNLSWMKRPTGEQLLFTAPGDLGQDSDAPGNTTANPSHPTDAKKRATDVADKDVASAAKKPQAWLLDPETGELNRLTYVDEGIANLKPSPLGNAIAFTIRVKLDATVNELYPDLPKANARIIDGLLYRHWNQWHDYKYSHLHVAGLDQQGELSEPRDLMPGMRADCPLPPFGGSEQFDFSPDGKEIALTLKLVNDPAQSTDSGIYLVSVEGGALHHITPGMPGYDMEPRYSPDGNFIAFHSMERASFESDRNRIMLYDRSTRLLREITEGLDQTTHRATWSPDSRQIFFHSETRGTTQVYQIDVAGRQVKPISSGRFDFAVVDTFAGGGAVLVRQQNMLRPTELAVIDLDSSELTTITDVNGRAYTKLELPRIEERYFTATDGKQIHNWIILPPDYDASTSRTWPMLTYCQGGPQGQIGQWFSYRWNFHLMAAKGYVVLAVNRRGLPGFGRQWNDQISGDWGGQAMQDILASTDAMIADPTIDRQRVAAVGASFGGYTTYWLMGNSPDRFCAMISHCGVFNLESMYGSTEELFFVNWDLGGPYWKNVETAERYERFSPHRFVGNWRTPLLVIHGEQDFRVPVTQGMEAFTAAQVQGVPSRFLYFPEEGHWVLQPQNGVLWTRVFFDWLERYCK